MARQVTGVGNWLMISDGLVGNKSWVGNGQ